MPKSRNLEILKRFMISKQMNADIIKQIEGGNFASEAEFFRQATLNMLRKVDPIHARPSLKEQEKLDRMKVEEEQAKMSDMEYVRRYLKDVCVFTDRQGTQFMVYRMMGNSYGSMPLTKVKEWAKERDYNFEFSQKAKIEDPSLMEWEKLFSFRGTKQDMVNFYEADLDTEADLKLDLIQK